MQSEQAGKKRRVTHNVAAAEELIIILVNPPLDYKLRQGHADDQVVIYIPREHGDCDLHTEGCTKTVMRLEWEPTAGTQPIIFHETAEIAAADLAPNGNGDKKACISINVPADLRSARVIVQRDGEPKFDIPQVDEAAEMAKMRGQLARMIAALRRQGIEIEE